MKRSSMRFGQASPASAPVSAQIVRDADAGRALELLDRPALVEGIHDRAPDRARAIDAGNLLHRRVVAVADPDADRDIGRVADRPGVVPFVAGAGLDGGRPAIGQLHHIARAEHILARDVVAQDIGEQVGDLLAVLAQRLAGPAWVGRSPAPRRASW